MVGRKLSLAFLFIFTATVLVGGGALAKDQKIKKDEVPEAISKAFARAYPFAKVKGYVREDRAGKVYYEVVCRVGNLRLEMVYSGEGDLYEIEQVISLKAVPKAVLKAARKAHPKAKVKMAEKLTRGERTLYELYLKEGKKGFEIVLDPAGTLVGPEAGEDDQDADSEEKD